MARRKKSLDDLSFQLRRIRKAYADNPTEANAALRNRAVAKYLQYSKNITNTKSFNNTSSDKSWARKYSQSTYMGLSNG